MRTLLVALTVAVAVISLSGCAQTPSSGGSPDSASAASSSAAVSQEASQKASSPAASSDAWQSAVSDVPLSASSSSSASSSASSDAAPRGKELARQIMKKLGVVKDVREGLAHGDKGAKYQKYIVLHDTEGGGTPEGVIDYWEGNERGVAAHFVVGRDGSVAQAVELDKIAHHAGFGDTGHNEAFEVEDESRDDKVGSEPIGDWASDYGMNSYSVGIEMIHVGGEDDYPKAQLEAVDALIAAIDAYFGKKSEIIDHKAWRSGNSDTSEEFSEFLANYQGANRTHDGKPFDVKTLG